MFKGIPGNQAVNRAPDRKALPATTEIEHGCLSEGFDRVEGLVKSPRTEIGGHPVIPKGTLGVNCYSRPRLREASRQGNGRTPADTRAPWPEADRVGLPLRIPCRPHPDSA